MKTRYGLTLSIVIGLFSSPSFAYYCSTTAGDGFINIGDSAARVKQVCGTPTSESKMPAASDDRVHNTQYWMYENVHILEKSSLAVNGPIREAKRTGPPMTFEITNGKITAVTQGNRAKSRASACDNGAVGIGDSVDRLMTACGQPTFVNIRNDDPDSDADESPKVTVFSYDRGDHVAPLTMQFDTNGKLESISTQ